MQAAKATFALNSDECVLLLCFMAPLRSLTLIFSQRARNAVRGTVSEIEPSKTCNLTAATPVARQRVSGICYTQVDVADRVHRMQTTLLSALRATLTLSLFVTAMAHASLFDILQDAHGDMSNPADGLRSALASGAEVNARDASGATPLILAAWLGTPTEAVKVLVDAGADVHAVSHGGITPLMAAARSAWPETLALLRAAGADPNQRLDGGLTPLLMAAAAGSGETTLYQGLLEAGADALARTADERTALMLAAGKVRNPAVIQILLHAGTPLDAQAEDGSTALMVAARDNWSTDILGALLEAGADPTLRDQQGRQALDFAEANQRLQQAPGAAALLAQLRRHGIP